MMYSERNKNVWFVRDSKWKWYFQSDGGVNLTVLGETKKNTILFGDMFISRPQKDKHSKTQIAIFSFCDFVYFVFPKLLF